MLQRTDPKTVLLLLFLLCSRLLKAFLRCSAFVSGLIVRHESSPTISRDPSPLRVSDIDEDEIDDDGRRTKRGFTDIKDNVVGQRVSVEFIRECAGRVNKIISYICLLVDQVLPVLSVQDRKQQIDASHRNQAQGPLETSNRQESY